MKKCKQHFSLMDNCFYDEETEQRLLEKQGENKKLRK